MLMGYLKGLTYSRVENPETGKIDFVKDEPKDPRIIYEQANQLVDYVNSVVENCPKGKTL